MQYIKLHKSGCVPYLALGAHCPPLTPLKFAESKFKNTEAKLRYCVLAPANTTCSGQEGKFLGKSKVSR